MSLREELAELMRVRSNLNSSTMGEPTVTMHDELAWAEQSAGFLRDHGQALVEAVADSERLQNLIDWHIQSIPDIGGNHMWTGVFTSLGRGATARDAIDAAIAARSKTVDGGGA